MLASWFAVSALTGRVHAFGEGTVPLAAGLGVSALPHDILDDDPSSLPPPLQVEPMLTAARQWVLDWEGLTPAQKAALHDRPARVPLSRAALHPPPLLAARPSAVVAASPAKFAGSAPTVNVCRAPSTLPASRPVHDPSFAPSTSISPSTATVGVATAATCGIEPVVSFTSQDAFAPLVTSAPGAPSAPVAISTPSVAGAGSRLRETNSERWAASHVPTTAHQTCTWRTEHTATERVWTQHFSTEHRVPHCLYCLALHQPAPDSPFCSDRCAASYASAETRAAARRLLFERELGVCQQCGFNAHGFFQHIVALPSEQARLQALMASPYSTSSERLKRMLVNPKEGDFWEADHIIPVAEGGGETSLDNFQTLCVPCHQRKTKQQAADKSKRARAEAAEGTADLRSFLAASAGRGAGGNPWASG